MALKRRILAGILSLIFLAGLAPAALAASLVVGGKNFTEQLILAEMTRQLLESHGHDVTKRDGLGTTIVRASLERGEVDLYWEYTGTSLIVFNNVTEMLSAEETYQRVKELDAEKGLVWLAPSAANNTYAMAIRKDNPKTDGMRTISDLAAAYNEGAELLLGTTAEFPRRNDGLLGLQETYDFQVKRSLIRPMDIGLAYVALANGDLDVMSAQATDGQIAAHDLLLLEDDKEFFPNYALTPVVREDTLKEMPELKEILESLSTRLDDSVMQRLNGYVDVERRSIEEVAHDFLKEEGLI
mgnify:CR=1 FL=1